MAHVQALCKVSMPFRASKECKACKVLSAGRVMAHVPALCKVSTPFKAFKAFQANPVEKEIPVLVSKVSKEPRPFRLEKEVRVASSSPIQLSPQ